MTAATETFTPLYRALTARGAMVAGGALVVLAAGLLLRYAELARLSVASLAAALAAVTMTGRTP